MLKEQQKRKELFTLSTKIQTSSKRVVHRTASKCRKECRRIVQPIWTLRLDKVLSFIPHSS